MKAGRLGLLLCSVTALAGCARPKSAPSVEKAEVPVVADGKSTNAAPVFVTDSILRPLGLRPQFGRDFLPADFQKGSPAITLISSEFWAAAFASQPDAVGRTLRVAEQDYVIVGIAPVHSALAGRLVWLPRQL